MSGHSKWSEVRRPVTPELRARIDAAKAELVAGKDDALGASRFGPPLAIADLTAAESQTETEAIDVERLAKAYHQVNCPLKYPAKIAWHSCPYQAKHRATAAKLIGAYEALA